MQRALKLVSQGAERRTVCKNNYDWYKRKSYLLYHLSHVDYAIWCHVAWCRSKSTMAGSLIPLISWSRRSCWSDAHCHGASLITASDNENVVCSVSWIKIADTLNTRFTNCIVKLLLLQTLCWNIFGVWSTTQLSLQIISLDQTCRYTWRPLSSYAFIKIKLTSCHLLLCVVYMYQKY